MLSKTLLPCLVALLAACDAAPAPVPATHALHERRDATPSRWVKRDRVESHKLLPMRIGLAQSNLDRGHDFLMDISDPASPNFGKHWTSDEVINHFKPSTETEREVRKWLIENGIEEERITHTDNKGWFAFYATTEEAERLLMTEYHEYEDLVTGGVMPACDAYHLPKHIKKYVDYVTPGIKLLAPPESHKVKRDRISEEHHLEKRIDHAALHTQQVNAVFDPNDLSICTSTVTPACIAALYQIPARNFTPVQPNNSLGIFESELQFWFQEDLNLFFNNFTNYIPNGTHPVAANVDGGMQSTDDPYYADAGVEVMLDLELAYPIVYPQTITVYQVDDYLVQSSQNDTYTFGFNTWLDALDGSYCTFSAFNETGNDPYLDQVYPDPLVGGWKGPLMCGVYQPTNVMSLSYGGQEQDVPLSYQRRQCLEFMKLGLQGVSFLFASGDSGVGNYPGAIDGPTGCSGPNGNIFNPTWPGTCPYVTSVGATKIYYPLNSSHPESAVFDPAGSSYSVNYSSGGGFSNVYSIPSYQASAVATFFANHSPPYPYYSALSPNTSDITLLPDLGALAGNTSGIYNRIGRGIPDVSAVGDNIATYSGGNFSLSGGTSAATPIFASVINRIIEERLNAGKGPLGFLNPSLYANPSMFTDIINGTNPDCNTVGFTAVPGWDPLTGLGTPVYPKMLQYFMSLP